MRKVKVTLRERLDKLPLDLQCVFLDDLEQAAQNRLRVFENMQRKQLQPIAAQ